MRRVLVTGGAGFIGSTVVRALLAKGIERVVVLDALTYAGRRDNLAEVEGQYVFIEGNIGDQALVTRLFAEHDFEGVIHLAAESHVDRSIASADPFVRTNVNGTIELLEVARQHGRARFVHVSTDEVFGALDHTGRFTEASPYAPNSPYAASKAASDFFVRAFGKTYGLDVVITNSCNNYGPRQLPEKLVPLIITEAAAGRPLPVYGAGRQIREWLEVSDHAEGLWLALTRGRTGESYLFGSGEELANQAMVERLADLVDEELGRPPGTARALVTYVEDRKGHDFRYAVDATKARAELGWSPRHSLASALVETVRWYLRR